MISIKAPGAMEEHLVWSLSKKIEKPVLENLGL